MIIFYLILFLQFTIIALLLFILKKDKAPIGAKQSGSIGPFLSKKPKRVPSAKSEAELYQMELDKTKKQG